MSSELAIRAQNLSKCYTLFDKPADRLKQMLWRGRRKYYREFWALRDVNLEVCHGKVLGIIGKNGAGKSTLLQLICGTLTPSKGAVRVNGRLAALLELGAGFNPEFSGRENIHLAASVLGLTPTEINARYDDIVDFSGIRDFIDQPVKTYSSGMYVRLAFSIATCIEPDILIIDEALSVGDGEFAKKSFTRIMTLKEKGATILFCSHSMYQIEALCDHAIWIDNGQVRRQGTAAEVTRAYVAFLDSVDQQQPDACIETAQETVAPHSARLTSIQAFANGTPGRVLDVTSGQTTLTIEVRFASDPMLPIPSVGLVIMDSGGRWISGIGTLFDGFQISRNAEGEGYVRLVLPQLPLLSGEYYCDIFLTCERGLFVFDHAQHLCLLRIMQETLEQGIVHIPHHWETQ